MAPQNKLRSQNWRFLTHLHSLPECQKDRQTATSEEAEEGRSGVRVECDAAFPLATQLSNAPCPRCSELHLPPALVHSQSSLPPSRFPSPFPLCPFRVPTSSLHLYTSLADRVLERSCQSESELFECGEGGQIGNESNAVV